MRRGPEEDEIELLRPHVARAEAPKFLIDLDPRAVPLAAAPELRPIPAAPPPSRALHHVLWASLALGFAAIAYALARLVPRRGLVPLPERATVLALLGAASVGGEAVLCVEYSFVVAPLLLLLALTPAPPRAPSGARWSAC